MNLDELKTAWQEYDRKLQTTQTINEKVIVSMIKERSSARYSKVRREYILGFIWMLICLFMGCAVLLGNPFDYDLRIQYAPTVIFCGCIIILLAAMIRAYLDLQNITISHNNLDVSLKKIIAVYERPQKFLWYTVIVFLFTQVFLFPLSFLPHSIERLGLWVALAERLIPISIAVLMLFIAHKLGAFKERHKNKFKEDLSELQELRSMSAELLS